jgi:coenzyme F420-reducing hydrogenase delta subunit
MFRELMRFVGVDDRRLHFEWVVANEERKWSDVISEVAKQLIEGQQCTISIDSKKDEFTEVLLSIPLSRA